MIRNTSTKGFTLIETLVAIAIIMVAITGPFVATENSISAVTVAHDKNIAIFLAQEGIEYVHTIRDKVYIKECFSSSGVNCNNWWNIFTTGSGYDVLKCSALTSCALDITKSQYSSIPPFVSGTLSSCTIGTGGQNGVCDQLYLTSAYAYTTSPARNTPTIFFRKIVITRINANSIKVNVTITWRNHGSNNSITADDMLTSWE